VAPFAQSGEGVSAIIRAEAAAEDEVVVEVVLEPVERHSGDDREDSVLEPEPPRRQVGRAREAR
jgi:hypothetical protein